MIDAYMALRQRKAISPAFSNAAIKRLTHVFYDSAYKVQFLPNGQDPVRSIIHVAQE